MPRDHWLLDDEKRAIIEFHDKFPLEGYRRLTFMMIDRDVAAASPASVYRVLSAAGLLDRWNKKPSKKGTGFVQPLRAVVNHLPVRNGGRARRCEVQGKQGVRGADRVRVGGAERDRSVSALDRAT